MVPGALPHGLCNHVLSTGILCQGMLSQSIGGGVKCINEQGNRSEPVQVGDVGVAERRSVNIGEQAGLQVKLFVHHVSGDWAAEVVLYGILRLCTTPQKASVSG